MRIQHNIEAMNANRQLNITGGALAKSARNLSSGYKINIAADDAAGLSISEKMRKQIRGLTQGVENTEDGVSLCQVADGALAEVHDMLQRINELAVKAANGTNSESDRRCINDEVTQLLAEIDRVGDTTKFNEVFIFKGTEARTREKMVTIGGTASKPQIIPTPPFEKMTMDCELTEGPFGSHDRGNHLALAAKSTEDGAIGTWNLIFGSGGTSSPKLVGQYTYTPAGTTTATVCSFTINLNSMTPTSYSAREINTEKVWSRTFQYQQDDGLNMQIVQTVTMHAKGDESQYYTVNYEVTNKSAFNVTYNLVHHEDTAYNNNDLDESYHLSGGTRVENSTMYTTHGSYSSINNAFVTTTSVPSSFSIILNENGAPKALSFTENIMLNADDGGTSADTLIVGSFGSIGALDQYTTETMSGILGRNTDRMDLGFSLVWSDKTLMPDISEKYSFNQGIIMTEKDKNIPQETVVMPTVDIAPPPNKAVLVKKDYTGGERQLWIQSGADAGDGMFLKIGSMNTGVLDIDDISTLAEWTADDAIERVGIAISEISKQRSLLGAYQNRLEHTIANEDNIVENTTAAESQIRDTDMAKEMVQYSNKNILMQAGQSMLTQANQSRQGILSLLAA